MKRMGYCAVAISVALMGCLGALHAEVVVSGTRVIYPGDAEQVSVVLTNEGTWPALVQATLDNGRATDDATHAQTPPFAVEPAIARIDPGATQRVWLSKLADTQSQLPTNKESLFWVNLLEVPLKNGTEGNEEARRYAFQTRIKLFYRPSAVVHEMLPNAAVKALRWWLAPAVQGKPAEMVVTNRSPYYVNFAEIGIGQGEAVHLNDQGGTVAPRGELRLPLPASAKPGARAQVAFKTINDYGAVSDVQTASLEAQ